MSKFKGICEITLTDSSTGQVVQKTKDENMITNALNKLLTFSAVEMYCSTSAKNNVDYIRANLNKMFGGVLLFDTAIEENPDILYPPANVKNVAHAGDNYSGSNTYRGTLNSVESGVVTGGYKFVWDFPTSVGNGTIKSVCLTNSWGGNCGYANSVVENASLFDFGFNRGIPYADQPTGNNSRLIKAIDEKSYYYMQADTSKYTYNLYKVTMLNDITFSNTSSINKVMISTHTSSYSLTLPYAFPTETYVSFVYVRSTSLIHYVRMYYDGKIETKDITLSTPLPNSSTLAFGELGNYIYLGSNTAVFNINMNTGEMTTTNNPYASLITNYPNGCFGLNGVLYFTNGDSPKNSSDPKGFYSYDGTTFNLLSTNSYSYVDYPVAYVDKTKPWMIKSECTSFQAINLVRKFIAPHFMTIDNLSTPVTKTANLTMKITYTIVEATE